MMRFWNRKDLIVSISYISTSIKKHDCMFDCPWMYVFYNSTRFILRFVVMWTTLAATHVWTAWQMILEVRMPFWELILIWRSVRSSSHTIPEKVRNSRPMNMGFKGWEWLLGWSSRTFEPFRYKKFNEWAQTANFSVFSRLRQELCAENPQNMEYEGN